MAHGTWGLSICPKHGYWECTYRFGSTNCPTCGNRLETNYRERDYIIQKLGNHWEQLPNNPTEYIGKNGFIQFTQNTPTNE